MGRLSRSRYPTFGAVVLALSLCLSGCGDDEPTEAEPSDQDTATDAGDRGEADTPPDTATEDTGEADSGGGDAADQAGEPDIVRTDVPVEDTGAADGPDGADGMRLVAVSPDRGPADGGTEVLVLGIGFTVDTDVYFGSVLCENIDFVDDTKIICDTPPNPAGSYDVKVINSLDDASLAGAFTYYAPVAFEAIEPSRGPVTGGMPATVTGTGFTENTQVSLGGRVALGIEVLDSRTIRLLTPPNEAGPADLRLSNENGLVVFTDAFEYFTPLRLAQVLPGAGPAGGGQSLVMLGEGFTDEGDMSVELGLIEADFDVISDTELSATAPPGPADSWVDVTVTSELNGAFTLVDGFFYYGADALDFDIFNVVPARGSLGGGDAVVVSGRGFGAGTTVEFGGVSVTPDPIESTYLWVTTPPGAAVGPVDVTVTDGGERRTLSDGFTYVEDVRIDSVDPDTGDVSGGTEITVDGAGFADGSLVRVGSLGATDVEVVDRRTITARTPPGPVGPADVMVETPDGISAVLADGFLYTADLEVHTFAPTKGAIAGGTYVVVRGAGFIEPIEVTFDGMPATEVEILDSGTVAVRTPPHADGFVNVAVSVGGSEPVPAADRFLYFDPTAAFGGHWGDDIIGAVNVTVLTDNGQPLPDAFVMLDVREDARYTGLTDENGQVVLSGPDLSGEQTVSASRIGFSSSSTQAFNAENITVMLSCIPAGLCGTTEDCIASAGPEFVCTCPYPFGACLVDVYCGSEDLTPEQCSGTPPELQFGVITGNLTGVEKVADPGPGERVMGIVFTTNPSPFDFEPDIDPGTGNVLEEDGPYTINTHVGELALVAVCGLHNDLTGEFTPLYMGVQRGLFIVDGEVYDVNLDCNIELDQTIAIKAQNPPFTPRGPDRYVHHPILHFGSEGYFHGLGTISGTDDVLSRSGFAPLEGQLAGLDYFILGAARTVDTFPESEVYVRGVTNVDGIINLPEFLPVPFLTQPEELEQLRNGYFEWELATDALPDFYYALIYDPTTFPNVIIYWDVLIPGDQNFLNLPDWPDDAGVGSFPPGLMAIQILAVDAIVFDYDQFDFNDFYADNWRGVSLNAFLFDNPR